MKIKTGSKRIFALIVLTVLLLSLSIPVFAIGRYDENRDVSITLICKTEENEPLAGETFHIYKVAEMSQSLVFTLCGDFSEANVDFTDMTAQKWAEAATALDVFVEENSIEPLMDGTTDGNGHLTFRPETGSGLYLIRGEQTQLGNDVYYPIPFLAALPTLTVDGSDWDYDPEAPVKYEKTSVPQPELISISVRKVWENDDPASRPASVTVALYAGALYYDEVTLSAENGWSHTWDNLDKNGAWRIVETNVPAGYTPSVTSEGYVFTVTNTGSYVNPTPTPIPPKTGDENLILPLAITAGLSLVGIFAVAVFTHKNNKKEEI